MTARSIRRAAERQAQKAAEKAQRLHSPLIRPQDEAAPLSKPKMPFQTARLQANRLNAQLSTGPITPAGRSISSLNAVKTGLTGRTLVLPSDDAAAYQQHLAAYQNEYRPVGLREAELVQSLADTRWRLNRIPALEMAIYAKGRLEDSFEDHDSIELEIYLKYEKSLKNLHLQEARLNRRFDKELAELRQLQKDRQQPKSASEPLLSAPVKKSGTLRASIPPHSLLSTDAGVSPDFFTPPSTNPLGFEFSTTDPGTVGAQTAPPETLALPQAA